VTLDPDEGLDADGYLTTGVARDRVPPAYEPVLADAVARLRATLGDRLHGLYLYGSVATGRAVAPDSDVDLLALCTTLAGLPEVENIGKKLSTRHAELVREVAVARATLAELRSDDDAGLGNRAFLKHYCVCLDGVDLRPDLPRCRPSRALAAGFTADLAADLAGVRAYQQGAGRRAARRLLLAAAVLESVAHGGWTTDRATGAALVTLHHPEWTDDVDRALRWSAGRPADPAEVRDFLAGFGAWLVGEACLRQPEQP
jgi:predicted nucleotidyltransferase